MKKGFIIVIIIAALAVSVVSALLIYPLLAPDTPSEQPRDNLAEALLDIYNEVYTPNGIKFILATDRSGYIAYDAGKCTDTNIVIPDSINGIPVIQIADVCFNKKTDLATILIPDSITQIYQLTFNKLNMPDLKFNEYEGGLYLGSETNPYHAFIMPADDTSKSITIHKDTKVISRGAFSGNAVCEKVSLPEGLTHINQYAFSGTSLREIVIPDSVTVVNKSAFEGCKLLEYAVIGNSVKELNNVFAGCSALKSVTVGSSVETVEYAFNGCSALESIVFPASLKRIGALTFGGATSLKKITIEKGLEGITYAHLLPESIKYNEYRGGLYLGNDTEPYLYFVGVSDPDTTAIVLHPDTYSIPIVFANDAEYLLNISIEGDRGKYLESKNNCIIRLDNRELIRGTSASKITADMDIRSIGNSAFYNCADLSQITLPKSVTVIKEYAFYQCKKMKLSSLPENLCEIGKSAFAGCNAITSISIPDSVANLDEQSFKSCRNLTYAKLPVNMRVIPEGIFYNCVKLSEVVMPKAADVIGESAFSGTDIEEIDLSRARVIEETAFFDCQKLKKVTFSEKLGYIGRSAFYSCHELSEIEIPNSLKYLGSGAFTNCFALESIHLPENMLFCSSDAFVGCISLKKLVLPDCVTEIKAMSFNNTKLQEISLPATIKTIRQDAFVIGINDPLNEIHFRGTLAEWEAIEKEPSCLNFIHSFKIICTDGEKAVDKDLPE